MTNPTESIIKDAEKFVDGLSEPNAQAEFEKAISDIDTGDKIRYIRTPNFTDCKSADTQLPINVANESISILSKYRDEFDFVDYIKEKLNYNTRIAVCMSFFSEQIDALVLAIKQFEDNKALILGDMAGIGKGRVVAGILRYAYQQGLTPIFITEKENLFSDMYRDIQGIGGFGGLGGNIINARPFIMCPYNSDRKSVILDTLGNEVETTQPLKPAELDEIIAKANGQFPFTKKGKQYDFNCIFLTYNVISKTRGESGDNKRYFLLEASQKGIIVMDECHNASGRSKLGEWARQYVTQARGVMFSSATFAKNPQAFPLYIIKTAMAEAQIDITTIENAIGVGGENVSEYISSVLVKEGQMIRRERDFGGCTMGTVFDGSDLQGDKATEKKERIYDLFNQSVNRFRNIYNYIKTPSFRNAVGVAILRKAQESGYDLAPQDEYLRAKNGGVSESAETERRDFLRRYRGRYIIHKYDTNTLGATTKFHFSENLLLSIKAKFLAESIIKELQTEAEYSYFDGKKKKSNRKPVIALRATGETLFDKMNLKTGDTIQNDFSEYIRSILTGVMTGKVVFRKINNDIFRPKWEMEEGGREYDEEVELYEMIGADLADGGAVLNRYLEEANNFYADMPLSVIDYLLDKIQSTPRKSWDRFGSRTPNYVVGEVTGRNYALKKEGENLWRVTTNDRIKAVSSQFSNFNKGETDVLILNASGSTGGSIHSNEDFKDQRPRIMFIAQVELDVNTEVQKRGRINRSGQVNFPAYLYVLSQVPSEIRKYLSLKRKLRRLDANTSANQTQNSDIVGIKDKQNNPIQDIFNIYGEEAFQRFISDDDNFDFKDVYDRMTENWGNAAYGEEYAQDGNIVKNLLQPYSRELEIYDCDMQEFFYDQMNIIYKTVVDEHKMNGTYQLELDIEDLKASLRTRVVRQLNNGLTEFSKPLFMEDKYCLERRRIWSKEKCDAEILRMSRKFYEDRNDDFVNTTTYHRQLLEDFELNYENYIADQLERYRGSKEPRRNEFSSQADYDEALNRYNDGLAAQINRYNSDRSLIRELLTWYKPNRNIVLTMPMQGAEAGTSLEKRGKFIGYSLKSSSATNKYSKGSIHFKFAFMGGSMPSMELTLGSPEQISILQETKRNSTIVFSNPTLIGGKTLGEKDNDKINAWEVNPNVRKTVRFLSGNILSGIQLANSMEDISRWSLVKYTNNDGTISTGIRLDYAEDEFEPLAKAPKAGEQAQVRATIQVSLNNPNVLEYLRQTPVDYKFLVGVNTLRSRNVEPVAAGAELIVRGLIRIAKAERNPNTIYVAIFQGQPSLKGMRNQENRDRVIRNIPYKNASNVNNPIFFAPFLNDYQMYQEKKYDRIGNPYRLENPTFTNPDGYKLVSGTAKIYQFENIDTQEGGDRLIEFLNKIYEEQEISLEFPQNINDYFNVPFEVDIYEPPQAGEKQKQTLKLFEEANYKYKLEVDFDTKYQSSLPPSFKSYEQGKTIFDKGYIYLSQPIMPTFARAYSIYPVSLSNDDTLKLLFSIFSQDERAEFVRNLETKIQSGDSISKIGDFVSQVARRKSVPDLKYIFGSRRTNDIGELLKTYITKGDMAKIEYEFQEESEPQAIKSARKKSTITVEDAEKFINYLLF